MLRKQENENATRVGEKLIYFPFSTPSPLTYGGEKNTIYGIGLALNLEKYEDLKNNNIKKKSKMGLPVKLGYKMYNGQV